jgi:hypothetical protein
VATLLHSLYDASAKTTAHGRLRKAAYTAADIDYFLYSGFLQPSPS